jgi:hypothetical protein
MYSLPVWPVLTQAAQEARSALPDAPVVPHIEKVPRSPRTRKALARGLRHLADVVAPPRPVGHTRAPSGMSRQAG